MVTNTASAAHDVAEAHARLRARSDIQFDLPMPSPTPTPTPTPHEAMHWAPMNFGGLGTLLFWLVIAAVVIFVLVMIVRTFQGSRVSGDATASAEQEVAAWRPEEKQARALLAEADAMAAAGKYAEAVHLLLHRSLEDIQQRRPKALRPALTSREIARIDLLPGAVRFAFAAMAAPVERSLFGGRALERRDWEEARAAYGEFALPGTWK